MKDNIKMKRKSLLVQLQNIAIEFSTVTATRVQRARNAILYPHRFRSSWFPRSIFEKHIGTKKAAAINT